MPSPRQTKTCKWCGKEWRTRSLTARTCSPLCRACHRKYDLKGRRANGQFVAREEVMPNVR